MLGTLAQAIEVEATVPSERCIGSGAYRTVFRYGNIVYKIGSSTANRQEASNYNILLERSLSLPGLRIPETHLYELPNGSAVVAQEFVEGTLLEDVPCKSRKSHEVGLDSLAKTNLDDMHTGNIIVDNDGNIVPIDLGANISDDIGPSTDPRRHVNCSRWCSCDEAKANRAASDREYLARRDALAREEAEQRAAMLVKVAEKRAAGARPKWGMQDDEIYCLSSCCWHPAPSE